LNCAIVLVDESAAIAMAIANVFIASPSGFSGCWSKAYRSKENYGHVSKEKTSFRLD
jgi:hypothetical protein